MYRGKLEARTSFLDVALFVAFFPQLVAGPVVRAAELLPQFEEAPPWSLVDFYFGFQQFLRGAVKKIVVADHLAFAVDEIFANEGVYGTTTIWIGVLAYAGQIYCDFSGYSDMAIGLAKMLGYRFCPNFNHPYVATSIQEFWKRWHISLSQWLRDYLYIPLGGNRLGSVRTNLNLMITMTLGGLWHGAAWTFVVWGVLHGIALVTHRNLLHGLLSSRSLGKLVGWALTFVLVLTAWVFFRAESFTQSLSMLGKMYVPTDGHLWLPTVPLLLLLALTVEHVIYVFHNRIFELPPTRWYSPIITALMIWAILMFPAGEFRPFVYFQF
ncbi:MAG: MBOAT family O-acyltransferase [Planctomycetota bacterium]